MCDHKPEGWPDIARRVFCDDAPGLVRVMRDVFAAAGDFEADAPAETRIGESVVLIAGTAHRPAAAAALYVDAPDVDAAYARAVAAGATPALPPADLPYGDRRAAVADPFGDTWQIATRL